MTDEKWPICDECGKPISDSDMDEMNGPVHINGNCYHKDCRWAMLDKVSAQHAQEWCSALSMLAEALENVHELRFSESGTIRTPGSLEGEYWQILYWETASVNGDGELVYSDEDDYGIEYFTLSPAEKEILNVEESYAIYSWNSQGFKHLEYSNEIPNA
jgi:hypothetical protein